MDLDSLHWSFSWTMFWSTAVAFVAVRVAGAFLKAALNALVGE